MSLLRWLGHRCLTIYCYALILSVSVVVIPSLTLAVVLTSFYQPRRVFMRRFRRGISVYGRIVTAIPFPFIRLRYEDHSGMAGSSGPPEPYIFVSNHRSASDAYLLCVLPHEVIQIVNVWPFRIPVLGQYARAAGYLSINRMTHEEFFMAAGSLIDEKVSIAFFPEGTRSASRTMGSFHGAAFRLALQSRAAIVPLCISGNENIPRRGSLVLRPGLIRVRRLPAIAWDQYKDMSAFVLKNKVRDIIQNELSVMESGT